MKQILNSTIIALLVIISYSTSKSSNELNFEPAKEAYQITLDFSKHPAIDHKVLAKAYGYLKGQQFTLDRIKEEYPELKLQVTKCELEFSFSFKNAARRIESELKALLGHKFQNYENELMREFSKMLASQEITKGIAVDFIEEVKLRAKGYIESPVLETLLTLQFIDYPSKEFSEGFVFSYSTKGHSKARGVNIEAKLPLSWKQKEGNRPHIVQKFISKNGEGEEMILIMVKDLGLPNDYLITQDELEQFFTANQLKQMIPDGGEFISAKKITLDGQMGGQVIFKITGERLDYSVKMMATNFVTIYDGKMIFLQCMLSYEEGENIDERFSLFFPLFRQVASSLILMDQY